MNNKKSRSAFGNCALALVFGLSLTSSGWAQKTKKATTAKTTGVKTVVAKTGASTEPQTGKAATAKAAVVPASGPRTEAIKFKGFEITLAGTLTVPQMVAGKKAPAVLIVAGSGSTPRDGVTMGTAKHLIYKEIAEHLSAQGFVTLRYDKRCVGESTCRKTNVFDDYVDDAKAAIAFLQERPEVDGSKIFLFGHSEGGLINSTIAANESNVAGLVLAAAPGRTINKILREQLLARLREGNATPEKITDFTGKFDRVIRTLAGGNMQTFDEKLDAQDPYEALLLSLVKQPGFVTPLIINDPLQILAGVKKPVLIMQGLKDVQISERDARYLNESLNRVNHPDHTLLLLPDADHLFKVNKGAAGLAAYDDANRPLDPLMLKTLTEWLQTRSK